MSKILKFILIMILILTQQFIYSAGSYLVCTDDRGKSRWARPSTHENFKWVSKSTFGFKIRGIFRIRNDSDPYVDEEVEHILNRINNNKLSAKEDGIKICETLVSICKNTFGRQYKSVGVSSSNSKPPREIFLINANGKICTDNINLQNYKDYFIVRTDNNKQILRDFIRAIDISNNFKFEKADKYLNLEKILPLSGDYYKVDINPSNGEFRDAKRIIVDWNSGKRWMTLDHYHSFIPLYPPVNTDYFP
ncbi:ribonuclease domain-containing protein [Silvanigrella aquatica]|uniref:Uncharacterized protein n=1 Tax=Silvanigrella aquatica TaxID=1915309 RepID=A0A1L4CXI1_9BACT|nr:ribonuclease domain-containing protein [Silvanigrella aquatica]APJ02662.1 hypothetical protein AXG55_01430 [Silvanigrella aquatica]